MQTLTIRLQRLDQTAQRIFGQIRVGNEIVVPATLEHVGILPVGVFRWKKVISPKRGLLVIELDGVPGHTNIQLHIGNTLDDSEGCVLVGSARGTLGGINILNSCPAYIKLMRSVKDAEGGEFIVENLF